MISTIVVGIFVCVEMYLIRNQRLNHQDMMAFHRERARAADARQEEYLSVQAAYHKGFEEGKAAILAAAKAKPSDPSKEGTDG